MATGFLRKRGGLNYNGDVVYGFPPLLPEEKKNIEKPCHGQNCRDRSNGTSICDLWGRLLTQHETSLWRNGTSKPINTVADPDPSSFVTKLEGNKRSFLFGPPTLHGHLLKLCPLNFYIFPILERIMAWFFFWPSTHHFVAFQHGIFADMFTKLTTLQQRPSSSQRSHKCKAYCPQPSWHKQWVPWCRMGVGWPHWLRVNRCKRIKVHLHVLYIPLYTYRRNTFEHVCTIYHR